MGAEQTAGAMSVLRAWEWVACAALAILLAFPGVLVGWPGFLLWLSPPTLLAAGLALVTRSWLGRLPRRPPVTVAWVWILTGAVGHPVIWFHGAPLLGWRLGGVAAALNLLALPMDGLVLGFLSVVPLAALLEGRGRLVQAAVGAVLMLAAMIAWLVIGSHLHWVVGEMSS